MPTPISKSLFAVPAARPVDDDKDWYYAFLTNLDPVIDTSTGIQTGWEVAFELSPKSWVDLRVFGSEPDSAWSMPKGIPELLFHVPQISDTELRTLLATKDPPAERQWYLIKLVDQTGTGVSGDFVDLLG